MESAMKTVNRLIIIVCASLLVIAGILLGILPRHFSGVLASAGKGIQDAAVGSGWIAVSGVSFLVVLVAAFVLWLEFRDPGHRAVLVDRVNGGETRVMIEAIEQRLKFHLDAIGQVIDVRPHVRGKERKVDVTLDMTTSPDVDIKTKSEEVSGVARDVVESKMGLRVGRMRVNIQHAPYPKDANPPARG
jgi:hypothetical protein